MAGYSVGINSETKAFKQGIESGVIEPLEDAQKELEQLGRSKGPEQLERGLKDAQDATERLADETKDAARTIEQEFRDTYRKVKQSSDDGMDGAKEGLDDFKDEANSTAREAAASFDGSAESIADMFQEVAANAFAGFGPAGAVAGLAAAAGIGLAMAGIEDVQEAQEKAAELATEWADRFVESGQRVATSAQQTAAVVDIATDSEKYKEATQNAELWGTTVSDAMLAMAGNVGSIQVVEDALNRKREATEKDAEAAQKAAEENGSALLALTPQEVELAKAEEAWKRHTDAMATGAQQANDASTSLLTLIDREKDLGVAVDELGNKVVALPDGTEIFIDAKTGQATADVSRFKGDTDGVIDHLNGRAIVLQAQTDVAEAQRIVNNFITHNNGRSFRLNGRVTVDNGDLGP